MFLRVMLMCSSGAGVLTGVFKMRGYCAERKGEREDMQDAHVAIDDFLLEVDKPPSDL